MAIATNTRTTYSAVGIREDLSNIIYNISPMDTPFMSSVGKGSCDNTYFEWQTDELAAGLKLFKYASYPSAVFISNGSPSEAKVGSLTTGPGSIIPPSTIG